MPRFRETGHTVGRGTPGRLNCITDVPGVRVGHTTLIHGNGELVVGQGPVRTGVTVVFAHAEDPWTTPVFAGFHVLNGCGEVTGAHWIRESGMLTSPIALTSTHSVGAVYEGLVRWAAPRASQALIDDGILPVVGETWDGRLNDGFGLHVRPEHVAQAIDAATDGHVPEGNVGGGTGMICHGFKGGIGTASRKVVLADAEYTVGTLVQANHGRRERLVINGAPVGHMIPESELPTPCDHSELGSIISVVATDVPLLPHQCRRVAQRVDLGIARLGGLGEDGSGDMSIAFSTANCGMPLGSADTAPSQTCVRSLVNAHLDEVFAMTVEAEEEAIVNALLMAETMVGRDGVTAHALPLDRLIRLL